MTSTRRRVRESVIRRVRTRLPNNLSQDRQDRGVDHQVRAVLPREATRTPDLLECQGAEVDTRCVMTWMSNTISRIAPVLLLPALLNSGCANREQHVRQHQPSSHFVAAVESVDPNPPIQPADSSVPDDEKRPTVIEPVSLKSIDPVEDATLESYEALAIESNPTLVELQASVDAANGRWLQVGLRPNPVAGVSVQELGNEGAAGQFGAFVGQKYITADKLELNRNSASWKVKQIEQRLAAQRMRVLTDVRIGFYSVRVAQERVVVAKDLYRIAHEAVEKAREMVKVQEPLTVLGQAEIEAELAMVLVENSQIQREAQWRRLAAAVGRPDLPIRELQGNVSAERPDVIWEQAVERLHRESPELAAAAAEVEQTRWALQRANAQAVPDYTLQAGVYYDDSSSDPFASLQMSMPIPIHDRNQGGVAAAHANVVAAEQAVQRVELSLQERLATVFQQYAQAQQQAKRYSTVILPKAEANLELNRRTFELGEAPYLAVLTAQRTYFQARLAWLNALERLWSASALIDGLLLSGNLSAIE